jgi:hypothetical protein
MPGRPLSHDEALRCKLVPTPPTGFPKSVKSRMKLKWNSFTAVAPNVLVSLRFENCDASQIHGVESWNIRSALRYVGYGLFSEKSSMK